MLLRAWTSDFKSHDFGITFSPLHIPNEAYLLWASEKRLGGKFQQFLSQRGLKGNLVCAVEQVENLVDKMAKLLSFTRMNALVELAWHLLCRLVMHFG